MDGARSGGHCGRGGSWGIFSFWRAASLSLSFSLPPARPRLRRLNNAFMCWNAAAGGERKPACRGSGQKGSGGTEGVQRTRGRRVERAKAAAGLVSGGETQTLQRTHQLCARRRCHALSHIRLRHSSPGLVALALLFSLAMSHTSVASPPPLRPAHETKHIPILDYPFRALRFHLAQLDNGASNGTALWLGAQCLSLYLADNLKHRSPSSPGSTALAPDGKRPRVIELGSGIGLSACVFSAASSLRLRPTRLPSLLRVCSPVRSTGSLWHLWVGT